MSDSNEVSESIEAGSISTGGMRLWKVVTVSCHDGVLFLGLAVLHYSCCCRVI